MSDTRRTAGGGRRGPARRETREGRWLRSVVAEPDASRWPPATELDGDLVLGIARSHRLAARAGARLAAVGAGTAAPFIGSLVRDWQVALGEEALVRGALEELSRGTRRTGLPLIALKGCDLARRLYGPGERPATDIDLLAHPGDLDAAIALLGRAGFRPDDSAPRHARAHWFATTFRHAERRRLQIDLHWGLGPAPRTRWNLEDVFRRAQPMPGTGLLRLATDDLFVYLALHAVAFHGAAARWLWWLDLWLLEQRSGVGHDVHLRARQVGGRVAVQTARWRARELFGGRRPPVGWRARTAAALGRALEDRPAGRLTRWPVAALAVDRPRDLWRVALSVLRRARS